MAHMRDKSVFCARCNRICKLTANLDTGRVTMARMSTICQSPAKCLDDYAVGVFDRQFGARIISPERF